MSPKYQYNEQFHLCALGVWLCGYPKPIVVGWRHYAAMSIEVVDQAILKMMEKGDE